jgi:Delta7-sterol 5-desaturase
VDERLQIINFSQPNEVIAFTLLLFLIVFVRYVIVSAIFFGVFYQIGAQKFADRKISMGTWKNGQFKKEIYYSALTSFVFALSGVAMLWAWQSGKTAIYTDLVTYGYWYLPVSLIIALFIHETYYYWAHRLMHSPSLFRVVHKTHHESLISSPWTAFSFHPWESLLQATIVPLIVWFLPMHIYVILSMLVIMTVSAVVNHLDIEIFPENFDQHWLGKWLIGATHHSLHHSEFNTNYGLYFTFWDKWMNTESNKYGKLFREKTSGKTSGAARQ